MTYGEQDCATPFSWRYGEIDHQLASAIVGEKYDPGRESWNGQPLWQDTDERRDILANWADRATDMCDDVATDSA